LYKLYIAVYTSKKSPTLSNGRKLWLLIHSEKKISFPFYIYLLNKKTKLNKFHNNNNPKKTHNKKKKKKKKKKEARREEEEKKKRSQRNLHRLSEVLNY
jgi:hypothetical protein